MIHLVSTLIWNGGHYQVMISEQLDESWKVSVLASRHDELPYFVKGFSQRRFPTRYDAVTKFNEIAKRNDGIVHSWVVRQ